MKIYVFGNGNLCFTDYREHYESIITRYLDKSDVDFLLCDFRGVDTLTMELLKCRSSNVSIYHIGDKPRYFPDKYKTKVNDWKVIGGFQTDEERDLEVIKNCTHFIAIDFNSDAKRKSGTLKNIEHCEKTGKIRLTSESGDYEKI